MRTPEKYKQRGGLNSYIYIDKKISELEVLDPSDLRYAAAEFATDTVIIVNIVYKLYV